MRGENDLTQAMFCYISPETVVPKDHPLRGIDHGRCRAEDAFSQIRRHVFSHGPAFHPAGEVAQGLASAGLLYGAQ